MAQAAVELPETPPLADGQPPASADELLSRLAGQEIDRLLEEAEIEAPTGAAPEIAASPAGGAAPTAGSPEVTRQSASELSAVLAEAVTGASVSTGGAAAGEGQGPAVVGVETTVSAAPGAVGTDLKGQITSPPDAIQAAHAPSSAGDASAVGALAAEATASAGSEGSPPALSPRAGEIASETASSAGSPAAASLDAELVQSLGEIASPPPAAAATPAAPVEPSPGAEASVDTRASLSVRVLEAVNAPVRSLDPTTRDLVGKIAIVTAFNAIFVLIYVLCFR
ncbi:MAG: hypothetical protein NZ561_09400 [Phycisphaerae bacterium]|nr:hypothetical protein [Phycisphaerae bacterium]MDW8262028.1 hypothetical protein [Phycisphaerales bacterium]